MKRALSAAADTHIPRIMSNYYTLDGRSELDAEFLVSATTPSTDNESEQSIEDADSISQQGQHFAKLSGAGVWAAMAQSTRGTQDAETIFFNITDYCEEVSGENCGVFVFY